jgi:prepilin-type N-terminal cleavage/methylation domain-containing protein
MKPRDKIHKNGKRHIRIGNDFSQGFTLVEILVALTIISIVIAGIIYSYSGQQKSELSQTQLVEMQQGIRAAMYVMAADIRMAGYDPHRAFSAGVIHAGNGSSGNPFIFTFVENDTDTNQGTLATVSYELYDASSDGDTDIGRQKGGLKHAIAENIQSLNFTYLGSDGMVLPTPVDSSAIRAVRIDIAAGLDAGAVDHTIPGAERSVSAVVKCRNLGL